MLPLHLLILGLLLLTSTSSSSSTSPPSSSRYSRQQLTLGPHASTLLSSPSTSTINLLTPSLTNGLYSLIKKDLTLLGIRNINVVCLNRNESVKFASETSKFCNFFVPDSYNSDTKITYSLSLQPNALTVCIDINESDIESNKIPKEIGDCYYIKVAGKAGYIYRQHEDKKYKTIEPEKSNVLDFKVVDGLLEIESYDKLRISVSKSLKFNNGLIAENVKILSDKTFTCEIVEGDVEDLKSYEEINDDIIINDNDNFSEYLENVTPKSPSISGLTISDSLETSIKTFKSVHQNKTPIGNPLIQSYFGSILTHNIIKYITQSSPPPSRLYSGEFKFNENKLEGKEILVIGAGAVSCEILKNLILLGVKFKGIKVVDMDCVSESNLSRQMLFNSNDVGKSKAETVCSNLNSYGYENVKYFNKPIQTLGTKIFESSDIIFPGLDNNEARLYVDDLCISLNKPAVHCGTEGGQGSVQPVFKDYKSYGSTVDVESEKVPVCTVKEFPYKGEHCVAWGKEVFGEVFEGSSEGLERDVVWGVEVWEKSFKSNVEELRERYPEDHLDEDGEPFWSGTRRRPIVISFDNPAVIDFITSSVIFKGSIVGREYELDEVKRLVVSTLKRKPQPSTTKTKPLPLPPITYDKDYPPHASLLLSLTNLRSLSYHIPPLDILQLRKISGNIIPALITTTSVISALTVIESLKGGKENWWCNLDEGFYAKCGCERSEGEEVEGKVWNEWTVLKVKGVKKFKDFLRKVEKKYGDVVSVGYGGKLVYANFLHGDDTEFLGTEFREVLRRAFEEEEGREEEKDEEKEKALRERIEREWVDLEVIVEGGGGRGRGLGCRVLGVGR
ncbi:hypothetical protein TL16_g02497 [Triparma laevis f. inornata]|uniref:THIF-type NAD/FAD binding fold domain-containing protein n=1 Tax=Triparma laevis f. inornata TaxID=1714386 RepID=A0A9W7DWY8_9STRA|nr:hypothetical protein TL16_g02497 [Triparma laevis f. inornata]